MQQFLTSSYTPEGFQDFLYKTLKAQKIENLSPQDYKKSESPILSYTQIALPKTLKQDNDKKICFYAFEVKSIKAKMALHTEIKKIFLNTLFDAILAVFYEDSNPAQFRLSLITFGFDPQKAKRTVSNLKRQSFVLGENTNTRSAQEHLQRLHSVKSIEDLENIFAREPISTDFFKEIIKSFTDFAGSITFPTPQDDDHTRQFVLRMFSRILFCKFLEKKGVISLEIWDTRLSENYYHDVLKPLFFQTLNTQKDKRNYDLIDAKIQKLLQDIPYLNGGLFDPQPDDYAQVAHINTLKIPNELFKQFFEILDRYHFTIDESTPIDQEVGLDPEMLGMVFENLLSVLFTDNKVDKLNSLRKKTGSYYTPREIVSYMVKSSILEHLKDKTNLDETKLKALVFDYFHEFKHEEILKIMSSLQDFKVLDPACGSGAFPMGMLQEICSILEVLDPHAQAFITLQSPKFKEENKDKDPTYIRKLSILQNNIYGVDIQPMAIEISRLRCFLSLVCEEDKEHIAPLPNLEFKFVTANSLIPMPKNDNLLIHDAYATIKEVMEQYFISPNKEELQKKYKEAQKIIAKEYKFSPLAEYDPFNPQSVAGFFDGELMFETKEFDCVIGNPPYKQERKGIFNKKTYPYSEGKDIGKQNLYKVFVEFAFNSIKTGGNLSLIVQSSLMADTSAKYTRKMLLTKTEIIQCIEFPKKTSKTQDKVFKSVLQGTCIISSKKNIPNVIHKFDISTNNNKKSIQNLVFEKIEQISILELFKTNFEFPLIQQGEMVVIKKIKSIQSNIQTFSEKTLQGNINTKYLKEIQATQNLPNKTIKILKGANCQRFYIDKNNIKLGLASHSLVSKAIKQNLEKHIVITQNITGTTDPHRIIATYTPNAETLVFLDTINIIYCKSSNDAKFLVGILNSKLMDWLFRKTSTNNHVNLYELEGLPIPKNTQSNQSTADKIIALVEEILKTKEQNPKADTSAQEREIDNLVYTLYSLAPEEIAIIKDKE